MLCIVTVRCGSTDAIGSVSFHPLRPLLLSVSGSRHFDRSSPTTPNGTGSANPDTEVDDSGSDHGVEEGESLGGDEAVVRISRKGLQPVAYDTSAKLWDFGARGGFDRSITSTTS